MKKYILLMFAFVAALTSCTNDDITISYATNFKINPSTVISPFTFEWNAGDLESFDTDYQLRIRLLVYDSEGILKTEDVQYFSNYSVIMNSSIDLPKGKYTAVVITDLKAKSSTEAVQEYWKLSEYKTLADTHIDDAGYIGGKNKILGISKSNVNVDGTSQNGISIDVQPAGAIFFVWYRNIHKFNDVKQYRLLCAKTAESCLFNKEGDYSIAAENNNGSYDWRICYIDVENYTQFTGVTGYYYILPVSNLNLKFRADTSSEYYDLSDVMTINPKAGDEWSFVLNLADEDHDNQITTQYGLVNQGYRAVESLGLKEFSVLDKERNTMVNNQSLFLKDIK